MERRQVMITARDNGKADGETRGRTDQMQPEAEEFLSLRRAVTAVITPAHLPVTTCARPAADRQGHAVNNEDRAPSEEFAESFQTQP